MKTSEALKLVGGLAKPSKMPGWAYGIPAAECKTGEKLKKIKGSTCEGCYAEKGCYVFQIFGLTLVACCFFYITMWDRFIDSLLLAA